jgi:hypothetical protein
MKMSTVITAAAGIALAAAAVTARVVPAASAVPTVAVPAVATASGVSLACPKLATGEAPGSGLAPAGPDVLMTGTLAVAWGCAALEALHDPLSAANVTTMWAWMDNEGVPHDPNNPMNFNFPAGGSTVSGAAGGNAVASHIQAYPTPADWAKAAVEEIGGDPSFTLIASDLKAGNGLEGSEETPELQAELGVYSGGGYDSIPAQYCPCNGDPGSATSPGTSPEHAPASSPSSSSQPPSSSHSPSSSQQHGYCGGGSGGGYGTGWWGSGGGDGDNGGHPHSWDGTGQSGSLDCPHQSVPRYPLPVHVLPPDSP